MSEFSEPKKDTVRITLPPPMRPGPASGEGMSNDAVRINMPENTAAFGAEAESMEAPVTHAPLRSPLAPAPEPSAMPPARPPGAKHSSATAAPPSGGPSAAAPAPLPPRPRILPPPPRVQPLAPPAVAPTYGASGSRAGPKKETARISMAPERVAPPARPVKMTKTQPLLTIPPEQSPAARVQIATPSPASASPSQETIPLPLVWAAFIISAITLLIQIWNYFAS